jgi:RNA polymerase Rpb1, domain 1
LKRGRRGGQDVTESQVRWLRSRGLLANVTEMVCLKSDDLRNRQRLQQLSPGLPPAEGWFVPAAPDSQFIFRTWLLALGLDVQMTSAGDHIDLTLRPATAEELLAHSRGPIVRPETINYRTYAPVEGGLFCERVYGPEKSPGRRRRFGHLTLPAPIVPLLWRTGSPSPLERLLGLPADEMERIVQYKAPGPSGGTGATAIRELLEQLSTESLPPGLRGRAAALVQDTLLVPPPDLRPLVLLDSGNFATSDLNDLYRRVINRANRLRKLIELYAPETIQESERRHLQGAVDALQANCLLSRPVTDNSKPPRALMDCLSRVVRRALESTTKGVDYSARARPIVAASLPEDWIAVPQRIFTTLGLHSDSPVLLTNPADRKGTWLALLPQPHDEVVLGLPPAAFQQLQYLSTAINADIVCQLHRPLGPEACTEARALFRHDPGEVCPVSSKTGWTDGEDEDTILSGLREAVLTAEPVPLNSARGLILAGTGAVEDGDETAITHLFGAR